MASTTLISYLNENSGAIQATSTIVLVLITGYYAFQARQGVREASSTRKDARLPIIRVGIEGPWNGNHVPSAHIVIHIKNVGYGVARDISITLPNGKPTLVRSLDIQKEHSVDLNISTSDFEYLSALNEGDKVLWVEYEDIFSRKVKTMASFTIKNEETMGVVMRITRWNPVLPN